MAVMDAFGTVRLSGSFWATPLLAVVPQEHFADPRIVGSRTPACSAMATSLSA